jgi:hypothetical protein
MRLYHVAQISNLLYRRIPFCRAQGGSQRQQVIWGLPIGNRRYSRLEICATSSVDLLVAPWAMVA